jgi:hypothetical protein
MPWLSRSNSRDPSPAAKDLKLKNVTGDGKVTFIPAQIDGLAGTSPRQHRQAQITTMLQDVRIIISTLDVALRASALIATWTSVKNRLREVGDVKDAALQLALAAVEATFLLTAIPIFLFVPGAFFAIYCVLFWAIISTLSWPMRGPRVIQSDPNAFTALEDFHDEKWIYINGLTTR